FKSFDFESAFGGDVIEEKVFKIGDNDKICTAIAGEALDSDATIYYLLSKETAYYKDFQHMNLPIPEVTSHPEILTTLHSRKAIESKEWVYNEFNSNSKQQTLKGPGSGAAVVQINDQDKAIAITTDSNSRYIYLDPEVGGQIAVAEAARNLVVSGAKPLALTGGLNYGNPTNKGI